MIWNLAGLTKNKGLFRKSYAIFPLKLPISENLIFLLSSYALLQIACPVKVSYWCHDGCWNHSIFVSAKPCKYCLFSCGVLMVLCHGARSHHRRRTGAPGSPRRPENPGLRSTRDTPRPLPPAPWSCRSPA